MLLRDDLVRRLEVDRLAAFMVLAAGGDVDVPDHEAEFARFERMLDEVPAAPDRAADSRAAVRMALGLSATPARR